LNAVKSWLSVIMPSYRGEQWIGAALESLACQDTPGIEILVIDSSPTTATLDIARTFSSRLHLRVFARPDLDSWHSKTNFGVQAAESEYLCWLGVDDLWLPGRSASVRRWIATAPAANLHLAPSSIIDKTGRPLGVWRCPLPANGMPVRSDLLQRLLVQNFVAAPAPVFRKEAWNRCGGLDETLWYTADWDVWLKLAASGITHYHDEVTVGFRIHGDSQTTAGSRDGADFKRQMQTVLERYLPDLGGGSKGIEPIARASIIVNTALAAAAQGNYKGIPGAAAALLRLGPGGMHRYFRDSRIMERMVPRIRAKLSGSL